MQKRTGEKLGWIGGWMGGFLWVMILSIFWFLEGRMAEASIGLMLFLFATVLILFFAPWRHGRTRYWKLMVPVYAALFACILWALWSAGGYAQLGLNRWSLFLLLPILLPFGTVGRRRWHEHEP